jgi:hypothetical protein
VSHSDTKIKRPGFVLFLSLLSLPLCHFPPPLNRSKLAHSIHYSPPMSSPQVSPGTEDAAYEETSAQLASYSRTLFKFTLQLWSESRRRAEELQKLEEAAASLKLSRPPQVRTRSVRSAHRVQPTTNSKIHNLTTPTSMCS